MEKEEREKFLEKIDEKSKEEREISFYEVAKETLLLLAEALDISVEELEYKE